MTKFIFENKAKKAFKDCSDEEKLLIIKSKLEGDGCQWCPPDWCNANRGIINMGEAYRVLAPEPVPNSIDWDQCPAWAKYCFTIHSCASVISNYNPFGDVGITKKSILIDDFPFFKRGTVAQEDSLLVRPEDK